MLAIAATNRFTEFTQRDVNAMLEELSAQESIPRTTCELVDDELAIVYGNSQRSQTEFREYPTLLRQAVSIARRIQDPLVEFAQMCNADEDLLCIKLHPNQDVLPKDKLQRTLYREFVFRVNEVGVDVNQCVNHAHVASLVQFVCGLGPRKGFQLLKACYYPFLLTHLWMTGFGKLSILVADAEEQQQSAREPHAARHRVPHGRQGLHQLRRLHQDRHVCAGRQH